MMFVYILLALHGRKRAIGVRKNRVERSCLFKSSAKSPYLYDGNRKGTNQSSTEDVYELLYAIKYLFPFQTEIQ